MRSKRRQSKLAHAFLETIDKRGGQSIEPDAAQFYGAGCDFEQIAALLKAMQAMTAPVKSRDLGIR